jgi:hypothetical protein
MALDRLAHRLKLGLPNFPPLFLPIPCPSYGPPELTPEMPSAYRSYSHYLDAWRRKKVLQNEQIITFSQGNAFYSDLQQIY